MFRDSITSKPSRVLQYLDEEAEARHDGKKQYTQNYLDISHFENG